MQVMQAIAEVLKGEGVSTLFCFPTTPIIEAAAAAGIRPVLCRQERVGVDMANGYARATAGRSPGVFAMQYGPGAENAFAGVASAYSDSTPLLLLPLAHPRATSQTQGMFRSIRTYASVTKSVEEITLPGETVNIMRRAFNHLKNGRLGPVMVEIPMDVVDADFGSPFVDYRPVRRARSAPDSRDIADAVDLLINASCPIIQAGQGVLYAGPGATAALVELAEMLDAPVMTTVDGKSAFPEDHPLSLGTAGSVMRSACFQFLPRADLVFAVGSSLTQHFIVNPPIPPGKKFIHLTNDPRDLNRAYAVDVPLLGDAALGLEQLAQAVRERLGGKARAANRAAELSKMNEAWLARWSPILESSEVPITPYRVITEFMKLVDPAEAIVTHDSGSPRDQILPFYRATRPHSYAGWGKSHQLGSGLGLTIGAKLAAPDKLCVNFMGDSAFGMTGLDFETAVRVDAPILTIVLNNSTMAIETATMKLSHERYRTRDIGGSYAEIAKSLGGWSERVTDPAQIAPAIARARRQTQEGRACLLEFVTSEEQRFSHRRGNSH
jgi:acetolactate synthase-1/2/3 large subunit